MEQVDKVTEPDVALPAGLAVSYEQREPASIRLVLATGRYGVVAITLTDEPIPEQSGRALAIDRLIDQVVAGLMRVQGTPFKSRRIALAITKLEEANHWLRAPEPKP